MLITADKREDKASVSSEGADGIPKFLRYEKICGRLPANPPNESTSGTCCSCRPQYLCTENVSGHEAQMTAKLFSCRLNISTGRFTGINCLFVVNVRTCKMQCSGILQVLSLTTKWFHPLLYHITSARLYLVS